MPCDNCRDGWVQTENETWLPCSCELEKRFESLCRRPAAGFTPDYAATSVSIIIQEPPTSDHIVNSIIRAQIAQNSRTTVAHADAQELTDLELSGSPEDKFNVFEHDLLFIYLSPNRGEGHPKGIGIVIGAMLLKRESQGLHTYLVTHMNADSLYKHYSNESEFGGVLRRYAVIANGHAAKAAGSGKTSLSDMASAYKKSGR